MVLPRDLSEELGYIESDGREGTQALSGFKSNFWYYFYHSFGSTSSLEIAELDLLCFT